MKCGVQEFSANNSYVNVKLIYDGRDIKIPGIKFSQVWRVIGLIYGEVNISWG